MAKWADYLISKVRYVETLSSKHIDKVIVHKDNDDAVGEGETWTRKDVINKIDSGYTFFTIFKSTSQENKWNKGSKVEKVLIDGTYYIKTEANNIKKDNIDKLPEF